MGQKNAGAEPTVFYRRRISADKMTAFDAIALGCPSMGAEELEETEFAPMFASCEPCLKDKKIGLFGSYGWGDGEWMRKWEQTCGMMALFWSATALSATKRRMPMAVVSCEAMGNALQMPDIVSPLRKSLLVPNPCRLGFWG